MTNPIKLTNKASEEYFHNSLCNSLGYMACYGLQLDYDDNAYATAKAKLKSPCYEDVLMQVLKDGGTLTMTDLEGDGEYTQTIAIDDVHNKVQDTLPSHLANMINGNDDADTGDVILQTVFFGEIIFG